MQNSCEYFAKKKSISLTSTISAAVDMRLSGEGSEERGLGSRGQLDHLLGLPGLASQLLG